MTQAITRPDWAHIYKDCVGPDASERPQELVLVTRHTLELAASAIDQQQREDSYHNFAAAHLEITEVLAQLADELPEG